MGFTEVYRYTAGKADWLASGLPKEGNQAATPAAGDLALREVPTCRLTDNVADIRRNAPGDSWAMCVVVNEEHVVLGLIRLDAQDKDSRALAEQVMEAGPGTIRPNLSLEETAELMKKRKVDSTLVTTPDGQLVGALYLKDVERRLRDLESTARIAS